MPQPSNAPGFEDLLVDLLSANEAGDTRAAAAIFAAHPEHEPALRAGLMRLERAGILTPPTPGFRYPDQLGDFRLLQRIGEGGMGIVFLAEQQSTRRKVAVKLVRPELLPSNVARERFRREVETIAQVQHQGIVPVIAVGEQSDIPYFAMDYVAGCSLAEVLLTVADRTPADLAGEDFARAVGDPITAPTNPHWPPPTWWQTAVAAIRTVADAIAYVHARGILHRDLKPSNIMVTAEGHALLLDFGLAHVAVEHKLTRTGIEVGSLAYMSPEQVRGEALDERTDVYSLGVTLYQLLTLRLPFTGANDAAVRAAILAGVAAPPRNRNVRLPRNLEVVIRTGMDLDRDRRYPSMSAMVDDLDAVLQHRPIAARRIGPAVRLNRWRRRHPFAAGAVAVLMGLVLLLPLLIVWLQYEQHVGLQRARWVAEADLQQARSAIDVMWRHTWDLASLRQPAAFELRRRMIDESITFYEQLHRRHPDDANVRLTLADTLRAKAELGWQTGKLADASTTLAAAAALLAGEPALQPAVHLMAAALTAKLQTRVAMESEQWSIAEAALDRMRTLLTFLTRSEPDHFEARQHLAEAFNIESHIRGHQGRPAEKLALLRQSLAAKRELRAQSDSDGLRASLAMQCINLADTLSTPPTDLPEAIARYREALELLESLAPPERDSDDCRSLRAEAWLGLGDALVHGGDLDAAAPLLTAAVGDQQSLRTENPTRLHYHYELARAHGAEARLALARSDSDAARAAADAALSSIGRGLELMPTNERLRALQQSTRDLLTRARAGGAATPTEASVRKDD